jgi:hypothetical protein
LDRTWTNTFPILTPTEHAALPDFAQVALHGNPSAKKAQQATRKHGQEDPLPAQVLYGETVAIRIQQ